MAGKPFFFAAVDDDPLVEVCTGPCYVTGGMLFAAGAGQGFLQMFNKRAADVTLGTTSPDFVVPVNTADNDPIITGEGMFFSTALTIAGTTTTTGSTGRAIDVSIEVG